LNLEWIFFDAGNTLIGLNYHLLISALDAAGFRVDELTLRRAERSARRVLDRAILERWRGGALPRTGWIESGVQRDFWRQILELSGATPYQADALVDTVLEVTRPAGSWDRVESSTLPALDALSDAGYRMGIISNSSGTLVEHLRSIGMARRFELIIDSHDVGVEKPHPDIFRLALETSGASASSSLYVGDVYAIDVLGAASAGMHAMLFDPLGGWDPTALPPGAPVCRTLHSLGDLRGLLEPPA
jgi:HAD superfamily hydrolase (TIGR01549 family)